MGLQEYNYSSFYQLVLRVLKEADFISYNVEHEDNQAEMRMFLVKQLTNLNCNNEDLKEEDYYNLAKKFVSRKNLLRDYRELYSLNILIINKDNFPFQTKSLANFMGSKEECLKDKDEWLLKNPIYEVVGLSNYDNNDIVMQVREKDVSEFYPSLLTNNIKDFNKRVDDLNRVQIPIDFMRVLGLSSGDYIKFSIENNRVVISKDNKEVINFGKE